MEEAASAASSSSDASLEGWLRSGCDPPEGGNCFLTKANAEVVFTSVLDCVFGRGDFGHLKVEIVPPGCTRENEDEWEEQFNEDYIGVDEEECYEVPLETRIMHPRGDRGYEAAMQEYAGELLEEKVSEVRANQRELQSEIERTKIRKRAWSFARIWLARQGQPISDGDRREAINVLRASREWFSSTGAKSAAQKVSTLRGRGLPPPVLEETLLMLIVDDLLGDWRRGEPSHPRKLRLPMWDEYWGEYDFECWWYNGARGSIEESAPVNLGARGELAGVVALANVVVVRCQKNHDDFMSDDGLEQLVRRLYKDSPVALCVALPAVKAALSNAAAAGYCEEYCLEDIANRILPALRNLRDAPSARDMGSMATSMSAWLAGSPTTEGKKRPRDVEIETDEQPQAPGAAGSACLNFECRCSACASLAFFLLSGRFETEVVIPEKARRLCCYASAEAQGRSSTQAAVPNVECTLVRTNVVRIRSHLAKRLAVSKAEEEKQRAAAEAQAAAVRRDAKRAAARGLLADAQTAIATTPGPLLEECIALASQLVGDRDPEYATSKEAADAGSGSD